MQTEDRLGHLLIIAATLFASLVFAIVSVATGGWSNRIQTSLLQFYQASGLLWAVGCVVLIILGIICLSLSAIILFARFFNHGKGRAILGGVLSIFSACVFIVSLGIFMGQETPQLATYGFSFALLWCAVIPAIIAGIVFFLLKVGWSNTHSKSKENLG
uniref:Epithelial membrane protein 3-like n=1 Tax=Phallusia mammillata TaxID=59560 RepID=A0A6F9DCI3_9ASCI|nr:epithelial membrane protein 3-like [Phallusia mammillata]